MKGGWVAYKNSARKPEIHGNAQELRLSDRPCHPSSAASIPLDQMQWLQALARIFIGIRV